uniref:Ribosomal protein S4 n=1 Tax=Chloropicon sp. RCC4434 TaxID=2565277 RepID=A0A4D6C747_9CHLO|nr:ribosomal protein S4 [Chloropicon sp. RCC4434]
MRRYRLSSLMLRAKANLCNKFFASKKASRKLTREVTNYRRLSHRFHTRKLFFSQKRVTLAMLKAFYGDTKLSQLKSQYRSLKNPRFSFLKSLECRVDVVLHNAGFFRSIWEAKQWISHGHVLLNGRIIHSPFQRMDLGYELSFNKLPERMKSLKNIFDRRISVPLEVIQKLSILEYLKGDSLKKINKELVLNSSGFLKLQKIRKAEALYNNKSLSLLHFLFVSGLEKDDLIINEVVKSCLADRKPFEVAEDKKNVSSRKKSKGVKYMIYHPWLKPSHLEIDYQRCRLVMTTSVCAIKSRAHLDTNLIYNLMEQ